MLLNVLCLFNGASARNRVIPSSCMAYMQLCKLRMLSTSLCIGLCHGQTFWVGQEKVSSLLQSVTLSICDSLEFNYRVFDNDVKKVGAYFSDQKSSLELKTGVKISLSLVHFYKYMSN